MRKLGYLAVLLLSCYITSYLVRGVYAESNDVQDRVNLALQKPVYASAQWAHCLVDGNYKTTISPHREPFPSITVDLQDVYNLSSIHVHAQNEYTFGKAGLNVPFSVYIWDKFLSRCDVERYYPYKLAGANLTFTRTGEEIVLKGPFVAQYIIVLPDKLEPFQNNEGLTMGELRAFGTKIREGYNLKKPDDGTPVIDALQTRFRILHRLGTIPVQFGKMEFKLNPKENDVSVVWKDKRIGVMASIRNKIRAIFVFGSGTKEELLKQCTTEPLFLHFGYWLNERDWVVNCYNVTAKYKRNAQLFITKYDSFDVDEVYTRLSSGNNTAVFVYPADATETTENMRRLMEKLNIIIVPSNSTPTTVRLNAAQYKNSREGVPITNELMIAIKSWKQFSEVEFEWNHLSENQIRDKTFQKLLREALDTRFQYLSHIGPCKLYPYKRDKNVIALRNYNRMLHLQRGENIRVAPGVWNTPGNVHPSRKPTSYTVQLKVDVQGDYYPTAGYAKPGDTVRFKVLNHSRPNLKDYYIQINPQIYFLGVKKQMARWPKVWIRQPLEKEGTIGSAFGGPVVISMPANSKLTIRLENVYRYPWFDARNPKTKKKWDKERIKYRGTPFGMIMGDNMISMIDSNSLSAMNASTIEWAVRYYDNVIKMMHNYRGTKFEDARMEVFAVDDDLLAGYGHSGYPWMGYREWGYTFGDIAWIKAGSNIGYPHEIGHNLQVGGMTFQGGGEVTNNMFIPVVHKYLLNISSYSKGARPGWSQGDENDLIDNWKSGKYRGVQVSYYNYFGRLFSPALVGNVIPLVTHTKEPLKTEDQKVNFWIKHMCDESKHDLVPFHRMWHFPISEATVKFCAQFPCVFPDDELTQKVPDLVTKILREYGKNCSRTKPADVAFKSDPMRGINTVKPQSIFIIED